MTSWIADEHGNQTSTHEGYPWVKENSAVVSAG